MVSFINHYLYPKYFLKMFINKTEKTVLRTHVRDSHTV